MFNPFSALTSKIFGAMAIALALFAALCWHQWGHYKHQAEALRADLNTEVAAHRQTKAAYRAAQQAAEEAETARLARVKAQQEKITDDVSQDYSRRLAALRTRYDRMRAQSGTRADSAPGRVTVSGLPDAASGIDEAPGSDRFSLDRRMTASQQALQLDALIDWVERQAGVVPN